MALRQPNKTTSAMSTAVEEEQECYQPRRLPTFGAVDWLYFWSDVEGLLPTPIAISITGSQFYTVPDLKWYNFDVYPHKVKMTNTGTTVHIGAKWKTERPYLEGGVFLERHILGQVHFHWGPNIMSGADHVVDNVKHPAEMQVTFFKSEYLTQEEALKHEDGVVMFCYLIKFGVVPDERLEWVINSFPKIQECGSVVKIGPKPFSKLLPMFHEDYFMYWGELPSVRGHRYAIRWLVPRTNLFATYEQLNEFRKIWDPWDIPITCNTRELQPRLDRHVFLINPHWNLYNSLLPIPRVPEPSISVISDEYKAKPWMFPPQNASLLALYLPHEDEDADDS